MNKFDKEIQFLGQTLKLTGSWGPEAHYNYYPIPGDYQTGLFVRIWNKPRHGFSRFSGCITIQTGWYIKNQLQADTLEDLEIIAKGCMASKIAVLDMELNAWKDLFNGTTIT